MQKHYGNEVSGPGILNYYSSREERLASSLTLQDTLCEQERRRPKGFLARIFGSAKSSRLTLLNLAALFLIFIFYQVVSVKFPAGNWYAEGFHFSLTAFAHEEKVFTSLRITKEKNSVWTGAAPEISLEGGGVSEAFTPGLPLRKDGTVYARTVFPRAEDMDVACTIVFAGKTKRITVPVKEE